MNGKSARELLFNAVASATPSCAGMFANIRECSAPSRNDKTNPPSPIAPDRTISGAPAAPSAARESASDGMPPQRTECSEMFRDVRECSSKTRNDRTNPKATGEPGLSARQVAAARLLALGRSGRAVATEVGVEEHTVTRWRRAPAFVAEVRRQHELVLAEQVRQRRAEKVDAFAAVADRIARKYGMVR